MFNNISSKKIDVSVSFLDVISKLQNNNIPFYITGSIAMDYYVKGYISLVIPERDDIDIVVSSKSVPQLEKVFKKKFVKKDNPDGTKVTNLDLNNKIDLSLFNDFLVDGFRLDFSTNEKIYSETINVKCKNVNFNIANKTLLLALKLAMFRGSSIAKSCDKRDIFHFKKYKLLNESIQGELSKVIPKLVIDQTSTKEVLNTLVKRYDIIPSFSK